MSSFSAGQKFREAIKQESPLQLVGTINANHALLQNKLAIKLFTYLEVASLRGHWACRT